MLKNITANQKGIAFLEIVIGIALLATFCLVVAFLYSGSQKRARDAVRALNIKELQDGLARYHIKFNQYPKGSTTSKSSCWKLNSTDLSCNPLRSLVDAGILTKVPIDPGINDYSSTNSGCGNAHFYSYASDGETYKLGAVKETDQVCSCSFKWDGKEYNYQLCSQGS